MNVAAFCNDESALTDVQLAFSRPTANHLAESGQHVVVTGAGGWIGKATLEVLDQALGDAITRQVHAFTSVDRTLTLRSGRRFECRALSRLAELPSGPHLVVHYAFLTRDRLADISKSDYIAGNEEISRFVTEQIRRIGASGCFMSSSGAVYRKDGSLERDLDTNPYGASKVREEESFLQLEEGRTRVAVCRVFNIAGPFINKAYALSSILDDIRAGGPVVLKATHPVYRSYVHVRDVIDLAFSLMIDGSRDPLPPYDTAGEIVVEVGELAKRAVSLLGFPDMPIVRRPLTSDGIDRYVGDRTCYANLLQRYGVSERHLDEQVTDTARYLASL